MVEKIIGPRCLLGEGPLWRQESQEFIYTDILNNVLYTWAPGSENTNTVFEGTLPIGAFLLDTKGDLILCTEEGVYHCPFGGSPDQMTLLATVPLNHQTGERFNDGICDKKGRILAGTKGEDNKNGTLWQIVPGQPPKALLTHLEITNGMGFSPDGNYFYHTDSQKQTIFQYDYDLETGAISHGKPLVVFDSQDPAVPDGMTVDKEGNLWTACWGDGQVRKYSPQGQLLETVQSPCTQSSSVIFGGKDLEILLLTSAAITSQNENDGYSYWFTPEVGGVEEFRGVF